MAWWNDWLWSSDPKWDPDKVICTVDDVEVDCFADRLESEGYTYDNGNDWYERTWTTNEGKESIREIYQQLDNGEWNKLMIGYGDQVFFEEKVGKP